MKTCIFLSTLFILSIFAGCHESPSGDYTIQDLLPLKSGNSWTYDEKQFDARDSLVFESSDVHTVAGQTTFRGNTAFSMTFNGDTSRHFEYVYLGNSGLDKVEGADKPNADEFPIIRYPAIVGEEIVMVDSVVKNSEIKFTMILRSKNESVTVPAGTFSCFQFDVAYFVIKSGIGDTLDLSSLYFKPGIGVIFEKDIDPQGPSTTEYRLLQYHVQ